MKKLFLLLLIFMLSTGVSIYGQVTLDGSVSSNTADDVDNISFSHTTGTGTNRLMLVGVSFNDFSGTNSVSSITFSYGATELSFTEVETAENSTARKSAIWSLLDPPSGQVGTVTVTFNSAVNYGIVAGVANFAGVDLTTPVETSNSATGNSSAQSVTLSGLTGDELVFDNVFLGGSSPVQNLIIGSSQTEQWSSTVANTRGATSIEQATGNSVTMSWSTSSSGQWAIAAVAINPAPTGPMIIITGTPLNHFSSQPGIPSTEQGYTVSGNNLTNDITITPPTDFEISTGTGGSFLATNPITLTQSGGSVVATTIYVRFKSSTLGTSSGNITHTSTGATQQDVAVSGFATPLGVDGDSHSNTGDDISSIDIPHTTGTGTNRLMLVGVSWNCGTTDRTISSITFTPDGESAIGMTEVITQLGYNASNPRYSAIYYLKNPPSGKVGTVTVTFSGSVSNGIMAGVANFSGVDQTTPLGTPGGGADNSTTPSVTLTGLNGNELVFDNVFLGAGSDTYTLSVGADQTELWNPAYVENLREAASIEQATGSSVTMSWTASTGNYWAIVAVPINPYSGPDVTNPTVTIDQAAGQNDPTNVSPINFKVVFNEPVTGFTTGDVTLGGSANPTTGTVTEISPFNGTTYNVAVSGITGSGTVTASISAGVAQDGSANPNDASTSTDNEVTYDITAPTVTINQAGTQDDPTCVSPINFTVVFSEPVNDFGSGDVTLGGTAGATADVVTEIAPNDGTTYNVEVSGMTTSGTVTASIGVGVAHDVTNNPNEASTSSDNIVTFNYTPPLPGISYVGEIGSVYNNDAGASLQITVGSSGVAAGNTIIVGFASRGVMGYVDPTVTDSKGNTYSLVIGSTSYTHGRSYIFYANVTTSLSNGDVITISTPTTGPSRVAVASEFSGILSVSPLDQSLANPVLSSTTTPTATNNPNVGPTGTTSQTDELIIGVIGTEETTDAGVGTWENSFIAGPQIKTSGATNEWRVSLGYLIASTTGTFTAEKTLGATTYWAACIATFKAAPAPDVVDARVKIFLEGPYSGGSMGTLINSDLPTSDPYSQGETVGSIPTGDIVDWILVELRSDETTVVGTRAAFLKSDGNIVDIDGAYPVRFIGVPSGDYYIVVRHRNHLAVMSATKVSLSNCLTYDFTTGATQYYGGEAADLGGGVYGMYSGDTDGDGTINYAVDLAPVWNERGQSGYLEGDTDMDGTVNSAVDRAGVWNNSLKDTSVPN